MAGNPPSKARFVQRDIQSSMAVGQREELDDAIAELFYGDNIKLAIVDSERFKRVLNLAKSAPADYAPPDRKRLSNDLLESTTTRLKDDQGALRKKMLKDGVSGSSDGGGKT